MIYTWEVAPCNGMQLTHKSLRRQVTKTSVEVTNHHRCMIPIARGLVSNHADECTGVCPKPGANKFPDLLVPISKISFGSQRSRSRFSYSRFHRVALESDRVLCLQDQNPVLGPKPICSNGKRYFSVAKSVTCWGNILH